MDIQDRLVDQDLAAKIAEEARAAGKTVVTTNGIFDVLHVGHVSYLEQAAKLGDVFIVALNSDASTKRIKGPTRPINGEADRARVMAALKGVDYVTVFEEDEPSQILGKLKPNIHTKAGDYKPENMPETKVIRENGGDVTIIPLVEGYSNTNQFKKIAEADQNKADFKRPDWLAGGDDK